MINFLLLVVLLNLSACKQSQNANLSPSIESLNANETLIMNYSACHWGCTKGTVIFKGGRAHLNDYSLKLTEKEIAELDQYFQLGKSPEEGASCSLPIEISFELKKQLKTLNLKEMQIYPCTFGHDSRITPERLMHHLTERANDIPFWRMSSEERKVPTLLED